MLGEFLVLPLGFTGMNSSYASRRLRALAVLPGSRLSLPTLLPANRLMTPPHNR